MVKKVRSKKGTSGRSTAKQVKSAYNLAIKKELREGGKTSKKGKQIVKSRKGPTKIKRVAGYPYKGMRTRGRKKK